MKTSFYPTIEGTFDFIKKHIVSCETKEQVDVLIKSIDGYIYFDRFKHVHNDVITEKKSELVWIAKEKINSLNKTAIQNETQEN